VRVQLHRERGVRGGHVQQTGLQLLVRAPELAAAVLAVATLQLLRVEVDRLDDLRVERGWRKRTREPMDTESDTVQTDE
jgi:hypothetical protein